MPIPIDLAIGLQNSLYYRTSRDVIYLVADCREIWLHSINWRAHMINDEPPVDMSKSAAWLEEQNRWMRSMIETHPSDEDEFWRHVAYIVAQFDGLYAGYVSAARPDWV